MPKQRPGQPAAMVDRIARALAKADGEAFKADPERYRCLSFIEIINVRETLAALPWQISRSRLARRLPGRQWEYPERD